MRFHGTAEGTRLPSFFPNSTDREESVGLFRAFVATKYRKSTAPRGTIETEEKRVCAYLEENHKHPDVLALLAHYNDHTGNIANLIRMICQAHWCQSSLSVLNSNVDVEHAVQFLRSCVDEFTGRAANTTANYPIIQNDTWDAYVQREAFVPCVARMRTWAIEHDPEALVLHDRFDHAWLREFLRIARIPKGDDVVIRSSLALVPWASLVSAVPVHRKKLEWFLPDYILDEPDVIVNLHVPLSRRTVLRAVQAMQQDFQRSGGWLGVEQRSTDRRAERSSRIRSFFGFIDRRRLTSKEKDGGGDDATAKGGADEKKA